MSLVLMFALFAQPSEPVTGEDQANYASEKVVARLAAMDLDLAHLGYVLCVDGHILDSRRSVATAEQVIQSAFDGCREQRSAYRRQLAAKHGSETGAESKLLEVEDWILRERPSLISEQRKRRIR